MNNQTFEGRGEYFTLGCRKWPVPLTGKSSLAGGPEGPGSLKTPWRHYEALHHDLSVAPSRPGCSSVSRSDLRFEDVTFVTLPCLTGWTVTSSSLSAPAPSCTSCQHVDVLLHLHDCTSDHHLGSPLWLLFLNPTVAAHIHPNCPNDFSFLIFSSLTAPSYKNMLFLTQICCVRLKIIISASHRGGQLRPSVGGGSKNPN